MTEGTLDPPREGEQGDELDELRALVVAQGGDPAAAQDTEDPLELAALAFDALLIPGSDRYTLSEVAERAGVEPGAAHRLWRAMGFPDPPADTKLAGDLDVEALRLAVSQMVDHQGLDTGVRQTRIWAAALSRISELWVDELRSALDAGTPIPAAAEAALPMVDLERVNWLLGYVHRRLMAAGLRRELASRSTGGGTVRAVAFADLVGFTTLTEELEPLDLSRLVETFEALAYDTVATHGGRVVKTIGDEVLYTGEDPGCVLDISRTLLDRSGPLGLPELRIGVDRGTAVWYEGDLYGPAVNRAARLVAEARPGTLVATRSFADAASNTLWSERGSAELKGIGPTDLLELHTA